MQMDAVTAARIGYRALAKGKVTVVAGLMTNFTIFLMRFMPRRIVTRITSFLFEPI
jgi:short-subunit dehydrogenase